MGLKHKIIAFIDGLIPYDYILFGSVFFLFIVLIILAILLRRKMGLAVSLVLLAFAIFFLGPTLGYIEMHKYLYKNSLTLDSYKKLHFSQAVVVKGSLKNESKFDFKECKITAFVYKKSKNKYKNYIFKLKPLQKMSILLQEDIPKGASQKFKIIVEPFTYKRDFSLSLKADCK